MKQVEIGDTRETLCRVGVGFYPIYQSEKTMIEVDKPGELLICIEKLEPRTSAFGTSLSREQQVSAIMRRIARGEPAPNDAVEWAVLGWRMPTNKEIVDAEKDILDHCQQAADEAEAEPKPPSKIRQWVRSFTLVELIIVLFIFITVIAALLPR